MVHPFAPVHVTVGQDIQVEWVSTDSPRVQGLGIRVVRLDQRGPAGGLEVAGQRAPAIMLWQDSAPPRVTLGCVQIDDDAVVRVTNRWRHADGREDEWSNNYGMLIEEEGPDAVLLRCSDGVGDEPTFTDLVVRITRLPGPAGRFLVERTPRADP